MTPTPEQIDASLAVFEGDIQFQISDIHLATNGMKLAAEVRRLRALRTDAESIMTEVAERESDALRVRNTRLVHELARLRLVVCEDDIASIDAVLAESMGPVFIPENSPT